MTENSTQVLADLKERTSFSLANDAGVTCPDDLDSAGATFLMGVRDSLIESLEWKVEHEDDGNLARAARKIREDSHELADGAVPVYTYQRWLTFVDLAAWNVDIDDYGRLEDMTGQAGVALYEVARALVDELCDWVETTWSELEDEGEQDEDEDGELDDASSN
jgi:hypothetical protein